MSNHSGKKGATLVEVLISFGVLVTTGTLLSSFLYKGPITQKARNDCYGSELSKIFLLKEASELNGDTLLSHTDANGNHWDISIHVTKDNEETCYNAQAIRNKQDLTRIHYYCRYSSTKEGTHAK